MKRIPGPLIAKEIIAKVAREHGVLPEHIVDAGRGERIVVQARHEVWRQMAASGRRWSLNQIGRYSGGFAAPSVAYGLGRHKRRPEHRALSLHIGTDVYAIVQAMANESGKSVASTARDLMLRGLGSASQSQSDTARIVRLHQSGEFDTVEIGQIVGLPEAAVCDVVHAWREKRVQQ